MHSDIHTKILYCFIKKSEFPIHSISVYISFTLFDETYIVFQCISVSHYLMKLIYAHISLRKNQPFTKKSKNPIFLFFFTMKDVGD